MPGGCRSRRRITEYPALHRRVTMERIAQTNLQLYNQLRLEGRSPDDLALIRRCYELSVALYTGAFQGDGKPFVAHTTGVASIMGQLGVSSVVVGAACIHNVYGNGNFGDGRSEVASPRAKTRRTKCRW